MSVDFSEPIAMGFASTNTALGKRELDEGAKVIFMYHVFDYLIRDVEEEQWRKRAVQFQKIMNTDA